MKRTIRANAAVVITRRKWIPEKQSEKAQQRHARAKKERLTCIDCHFAIAHNEPQGGLGPQELEVDKSLISKGAIF